jgi:hypothetical protein
MKRKTLFAVLFFFFGVLLFTRLDFMVNSSLYNFGLEFSENWYVEYTALYTLYYQLLIFCLLLYAKDLKLFSLMEVFVFTATQDLFFYGLWQGSFPSIEWSWTTFYMVLGSWTTNHQLLLSLSGNLIAFVVIFRRRIAMQFYKLKKPSNLLLKHDL